MNEFKALYSLILRTQTTRARVLMLGALGVPAGRFEIAALVPVGHPTGAFGVAQRKPASAVTHWNEWGRKRR